ncbi:Uncharacterised protein [Klebsiella pneumoniae]|nr:Uncharacterised protein [Klebsiella pneumoniae]
MGVSIIKELAANPGLVFGGNGIGFRPESRRECNILRRMLPLQIAREISQEEFDFLYGEISEHYDEEMKDMLADMREAEMEDRHRSGDIHIYDEQAHDAEWM